MRQILKEFVQRVRFWIKRFNTCHNLKSLHSKKATFWIMLLYKKDDIFGIFPAFWKAWFLIKDFTKR